MRRVIFAPCLAALVAVLLAACAGSESEPGGDLHIFNWEDYLGPTTIADFEAKYGINVILETFDTEAGMVSAVESEPSAYDLIVTSDATVADMVDMRLLGPIDIENVPNLSHVDPAFYVPTPDESWSALADPAVAGRVALVADVHAAIGNYVGYAIPNRTAAEQGLVDEELAASVAAYPPLDRLESWVPYAEKGSRAMSRWNEAMARIEAAVAAASVSAEE